ncbi:hypothetical protein EON67_12155 [archaeon]|nr:MAG: hypothetical protein EON67_12155 [archaeon]
MRMVCVCAWSCFLRAADSARRQVVANRIRSRASPPSTPRHVCVRARARARVRAFMRAPVTVRVRV